MEEGYGLDGSRSLVMFGLVLGHNVLFREINLKIKRGSVLINKRQSEFPDGIVA